MQGHYLVEKTALPLVQVDKLVGSAQEKRVPFSIDSQVNVSLNFLQLRAHQQFSGKGQGMDGLLAFLIVFCDDLSALHAQKRPKVLQPYVVQFRIVPL